MKIAWVTPFNRRSAIGRVSASVTRLLWARGHEVTIIRSELRGSDPSPLHPTPLRVLRWNDLKPSDVDAVYDAIVVNIGDHYGFHAGCLPFLNDVPCLGIFHDYFLYYLFYEWLRDAGFQEQMHNHEVVLTYGLESLDVAQRAWKNPHALEMIAKSIPMTEWLGRKCGAALAHSQFYVPRLEASCPGPIAVAPLCFDARSLDLQAPGNGDELVLTTIGNMNANKCADAAINAIAASPLLRERCRYRLVGSITRSERTRLETLCQEVGFQRLDILGEVNDPTLVRELERADVLVCLRKPVLEGASASAIEGMKSGRPIVVADAGFYADLPSDLVFKVPATVDIPSLTTVLDRLLADPTLRRETGARAKTWAMQTFTNESYVDALEGLLDRFTSAKPLLAVGQRIGQQIAELGVEENDLSLQRVAQKATQLFGNGQ